ncbi:hypothetical protein HID58_010639, partial [Brassica napus]
YAKTNQIAEDEVEESRDSKLETTIHLSLPSICTLRERQTLFKTKISDNMGSFPALIIILASSLLTVLEVVNGAKCYGSSNSNSSYARNRDNLFSTLANNVVTNGGVYNSSLGQYPNKVYVLGLCARGYEPKPCISCVEKLTLETQTGCGSIMESFIWDSDDGDRVSCLVRSSNHSFGNLELEPPVIGPSPNHFAQSVNMTLFMQQWEYTVNNTLVAATKADTSSMHKYYSAVHAQFTEFPNVYMMMQCTPDITSQDCKQCLEDSVKYFREQFRGKTGGMASFPSCLFRWDLYSFYGAFGNVTRVPALPLLQAPKKGSSVPEKKAKDRRRKLNNGINGCTLEYSDSDGHFMLRFDLSMIILATADFSPENKLGQGGFGTVYKGILLNGKEIAVKRLTRGSEGGVEFKNEVSLLTRLQHKNLVKLLGFCNEGDEEILVYEFVPNSSLDRFIFDEEKRELLTWEVRFKIIEGIARGLVYLHEDSQLKIIHRDLKASNILLDAEMNPKVADFGTARLFDTDETRAETQRIAGTRWVEGKPEIIIDPLLVKKPSSEIIKLIQTGLLCAQQNPTKRPTMSTVILWLGSETITIPLPKAPAFTASRSQSEDGTTSMSNVLTELSCPLMIILASSLLFVLQTLEVVNGAKCYGSLAGNNSYAQNRKNLFSTLTNKVLANGGFYNASLGQYPNRVYALGLCARGFKPKVCLSCLERLSLETQRDCPNIMDSFVWGGDDEELVSCLVRSSNHSFGNLEISPPNIRMSPYHIRPLINMTLFMLEWEYTVNRTLEAATKAHASSAHKYYSASYAEFTAFPNVYMLMQCTPDITSQGCKQCLEACLKYFREQFLGRIGGIATFPSCYFRWDLYPFHGAFLNVTRVPALPRPPPQEKGSSIPDKKGRSMNRGIITIIVVLTFIHLLVFIGFYKVIARRLKINNGKNVGGAEYTDSDGQFMLRGYMAPEYLNHGQISAKCDVYSFGVVLLEMITGQRNNSFEEGIAAFVWKRWSEGRPVVIIDPLLVENPNVQIIKYIQTGLLCVQEDASKRPTMSSVMVWLGSETITIPSPKAPDYTKSFSDRL